MISTKMMLAGMLLVAGLAPGLQVRAADQVVAQGAVTNTGVANRGTTGFETIRQFVLQHTSRLQSQSLADENTWPESFTVVSTKVIRSAADLARAQDVSYPPTPLPPKGNAGDTFSISSCSKNVSETWSYMWGSLSTGGSGWVLQSYSWKLVNNCKSQPVSQ